VSLTAIPRDLLAEDRLARQIVSYGISHFLRTCEI